MVRSLRGLLRGGVVLPWRMTSNHTPSSAAMVSGRPLVLVANQPTIDGGRSSSSMPAASRASLSATVDTLSLAIASMSLQRIGAPIVSCWPSRMCTPC